MNSGGTTRVTRIMLGEGKSEKKKRPIDSTKYIFHDMGIVTHNQSRELERIDCINHPLDEFPCSLSGHMVGQSPVLLKSTLLGEIHRNYMTKVANKCDSRP